MMRRVLLCAAIAACGPHPPPAPPPIVAPVGPPQLAALPVPVVIDTPRYAGTVTCVRCHTAGEQAMRDAAGRDVSPIAGLAATMMALSSRDPYYLAALRRELDAHPGDRATVIPLCVRCHAAVGFAEAVATAGETSLGLPELTAGTTPAAILGREGVGCAGCHAAPPTGLGSETSFVGRVALATDRVSYGALAAPLAEAMVKMVNTRPQPSPHISRSAVCASCHTVLVHSLDDGGDAEVAEQATYLEWRDSAFQDEDKPGPRAATCQHCHMPGTDDDGTQIITAYATRPPTAPPHDAYARHDIHGGNAYLLGRLAEHAAWLLGADPRPTITGAPTAEALRTAAHATERFLTTAAKLEIAPTRGGARVTVVNLTGHKLPTGFPTRRMWLHVTARDASGAVVLESGAHKDGAIVGAGGARLDGPGVILPHTARIAGPSDVAIWEAVAVDAAGARTHVLLGTARLVKDDRLLPAGWRAGHRDGARTKPRGVTDDPLFVPGSATVTIAFPAGAVSLDAELDYQSIPPETISSYRPTDSPEAARFLAVTDAPPLPQVIAHAHWQR